MVQMISESKRKIAALALAGAMAIGGAAGVATTIASPAQNQSGIVMEAEAATKTVFSVSDTSFTGGIPSLKKYGCTVNISLSAISNSTNIQSAKCTISGDNTSAFTAKVTSCTNVQVSTKANKTESAKLKVDIVYTNGQEYHKTWNLVTAKPYVIFNSKKITMKKGATTTPGYNVKVYIDSDHYAFVNYLKGSNQIEWTPGSNKLSVTDAGKITALKTATGTTVTAKMDGGIATLKVDITEK